MDMYLCATRLEYFFISFKHYILMMISNLYVRVLFH